MVFDYENRTRKPVKFPMKKPGGFLSHFFRPGPERERVAAGPVARGGVAGDLRRPGAVPVVGPLCLFFGS